jgi:hypothetical protein
VKKMIEAGIVKPRVKIEQTEPFSRDKDWSHCGKIMFGATYYLPTSTKV